MIPVFKPMIDPLTTRFPRAWAKACAPHDDGEFNARVCAVLHYEMGMTQVGRNGKRGDPKNLSRDVINWKGEGANFDPTNGNAPCKIIDFIIGHESASAEIGDVYSDPNGPGAWVKPLTLAEIDAGGANPVPQPPAIVIPSYAELGDDPFFRQSIGVPLAADMAHAGEALNDGSSVWFSRATYRLMAAILKHRLGLGPAPNPAAEVRIVREEWRAVLKQNHPGLEFPPL